MCTHIHSHTYTHRETHIQTHIAHIQTQMEITYRQTHTYTPNHHAHTHTHTHTHTIHANTHTTHKHTQHTCTHTHTNTPTQTYTTPQIQTHIAHAHTHTPHTQVSLTSDLSRLSAKIMTSLKCIKLNTKFDCNFCRIKSLNTIVVLCQEQFLDKGQAHRLFSRSRQLPGAVLLFLFGFGGWGHVLAFFLSFCLKCRCQHFFCSWDGRNVHHPQNTSKIWVSSLWLWKKKRRRKPTDILYLWNAL